ncbi:IS21 family transposase [Flagellatimonas centrodinii]|nr:IS21 family transposase [Flagellatimonas centrodinii]ULQ48292.1 IS21 family transposase [Flagellatimonas centrodinii]
MELLAKIRRWHFRDQVPIREIARRTSLSKNTVKSYLRSGDVTPEYRRKRMPHKLDPYAEQLQAWLKSDQGKPRKQRRTAKRYFELLKAQGYTGEYSRVTDFVRGWRREQSQTRRDTYVPLAFAPGEALQFDWSTETAEIGGIVTTLKVAQIKLCHSRMALRVAYPSEAHEMLFDAHWRAFAFFGGIPRRAIYDNMKTAVDKVGQGKARKVNQRFGAMMSHYLLEPEFCNRAAGWEKGRVEKAVQDGRRELFVPRPRFETLDQLNAWLAEQCLRLADEIRHPEIRGQSVAEVFAQEQAHLMALGTAFDAFVEEPVRVSPTCLVSFERNRYSVHAAFANRAVSLRAYADRIEVVGDGEVIARHGRVFGRGQTIYDWRHYIPVLARKPGALRNGAPFADLPGPLQRLQDRLLRRPGGDREMADILGCVPTHGLDDVLVAVELALEGKHPSREHVFNLLARLREPKAPDGVQAPAALTLTQEPRADVARYDTLRVLLPILPMLPLLAEVRHAAH